MRRDRDPFHGLLLFGTVVFSLAGLGVLVAVEHQDEQIHRLQEQQRYASRELEHHLEETHVYDH